MWNSDTEPETVGINAHTYNVNDTRRVYLNYTTFFSIERRIFIYRFQFEIITEKSYELSRYLSLLLATSLFNALNIIMNSLKTSIDPAVAALALAANWFLVWHFFPSHARGQYWPRWQNTKVFRFNYGN